MNIRHLTMTELEAGLDEVLRSPGNHGVLELIVARPEPGARTVLDAGQLSLTHGLVGDSWAVRGSKRTHDGTSHPDMQLNIINARFAALIAQTPERRALAGDQLYLDMDLSRANLPPGTELAIGDTIIAVTAQPHRGCKKFVQRFGIDAMTLANSDVGRQWNLRGVNARVVTPGRIAIGDIARKRS